MKSLKMVLLGLTLSLFLSTQANGALVDECSKELLLTYFPEPFLMQVLKDNDVPENEWAPINEELMAKDRDVVSLVEEKAAAMDPNPLSSSKFRPQAVQLFRETLFEVFSSVMRNHGITDDAEIQAMLDQIQFLKAERFQKCMENSEDAVNNAFEIQSRAEGQTSQYTAMMVEESDSAGGEEDVDIDESETMPDNSDQLDLDDIDSQGETTNPLR